MHPSRVLLLRYARSPHTHGRGRESVLVNISQYLQSFLLPALLQCILQPAAHIHNTYPMIYPPVDKLVV